MSVAAVVRWFDQFIDELEREGGREAVIGALRRGRRLATGEELEELEDHDRWADDGGA